MSEGAILWYGSGLVLVAISLALVLSGNTSDRFNRVILSGLLLIQFADTAFKLGKAFG
jgi:hypothetical protein